MSAVYAVAFAGASALLRRRGFELAGGIAAVLAVTMTPVWSWAVLRLTGEWPDPLAWDNALARYDPFIASRLIIIELATIGVALATWAALVPSVKTRLGLDEAQLGTILLAFGARPDRDKIGEALRQGRGPQAKDAWRRHSVR